MTQIMKPSKFEVLQISEILRQRVGIFSWHLTHPTHDFFKSRSTYWILFYMTTGFIISSIMYILKSTELSVQLETAIVVIAGVQCIGMFVGVGCNLKKAKTLHYRLQEIVDKAEGEIFDNYWKVEQKCQKYTTNISRYIHGEQMIFISALVESVIGICTGDIDTSKWSLPVALVVPFDEIKLWTWYLLWFYQCNMGLSYASCMIPVTAYFVCCCCYIDGICEHFELLMRNASNYAEDYQHEKNPNERTAMYMKLKSTISQAIDTHVDLLDIFNLTAEINSATIFALLPINVLFLAITMSNIERSEFDTVTIVFNIVNLICLIWPIMYCYFASKTTDRIADIGTNAYFMNWYNYPKTMQRYFTLINIRSQNEMQFSGLGLIDCTVETFGKLFKSACSYYLIFREI